MNADDVGHFLSRWSRRKLGKEAEKAPEPEAPVADAGPPAQAMTGTAVETAGPAAAEPLPPVDSLTPDSDFKPFMRADVAPDVKQAALKQLFKDPHFNVMDGLDTYIDDYSKPDPIPAEMMKKLYQARQLLFTPEEKAAADAADAAEAKEAAERELIESALAEGGAPAGAGDPDAPLAEVPAEYLAQPAKEA